MAYQPEIPITPADGLNPTTANLIASLLNAFNGLTYDRLRTNNSFITAAANPDLGLLAMMMPDRRYTAGVLATPINSALTYDTNGADSFTFSCQTTTTGTVIFEVSADGTNWYSAETRQSNTDAWLTGQNITPTAGGIFRVVTIGIRTVRIRTVTTLGAAVTFVATSSARTAFVTAIKTGPAPHSFGYTPIHKDVEYTTAQTGAAIWTPAAGKKFVVTDLTIATGGTTGGIVTVWQGASADTTYTAGTDPALFRGEFAPSATAKPGLIKSFKNPFVSSAADHVLRITTSAAMTIYLQVEGYEI